MGGTTKDLQELVRERHKDELVKEIPVLKTVKDWIAADFETWEKVLKTRMRGVIVSQFRGKRGRTGNKNEVRNKGKELEIQQLIKELKEYGASERKKRV
jgi:hypothetical protein